MEANWTWWQNALRGDFGPIHDGHPQQGFYRVREGKGGRWLPVAIWFEDGEAVGLRDNTTIDPDRIWTWCCRNPVTFEAYDAAVKGNGWADDAPPPASLGHNLPSDPAEKFRVELADEEAEIKRWLATDPIKDRASADRAANWAERVAGLGKEAEEARKIEKKPHDDGARAVQAKWKPIVDQADSLKRLLKESLGPYLRQQAAEEAARRAAEARKAAMNGEVLPPLRNASAGTAGRKVALRTVRNAIVEDFDAALTFFKENPDVRDLIQRLAQKAITAGATVPGVRVEEEKVAA